MVLLNILQCTELHFNTANYYSNFNFKVDSVCLDKSHLTSTGVHLFYSACCAHTSFFSLTASFYYPSILLFLSHDPACFRVHRDMFTQVTDCRALAFKSCVQTVGNKVGFLINLFTLLSANAFGLDVALQRFRCIRKQMAPALLFQSNVNICIGNCRSPTLYAR